VGPAPPQPASGNRAADWREIGRPEVTGKVARNTALSGRERLRIRIRALRVRRAREVDVPSRFTTLSDDSHERVRRFASRERSTC
jgi:hypothetical protein